MLQPTPLPSTCTTTLRVVISEPASDGDEVIYTPDPPYDVYCGRKESCPEGWKGDGADGYFGNYTYALDKFEAYFNGRLHDSLFRARVLSLRGKRLACFCKIGVPCHVDHIIGWLEEEDAEAQGIDLLQAGLSKLTR